MKGFLAQKFYGLLVVRNRLNTTTSFRRNEFEEVEKIRGEQALVLFRF